MIEVNKRGVTKFCVSSMFPLSCNPPFSPFCLSNHLRFLPPSNSIVRATDSKQSECPGRWILNPVGTKWGERSLLQLFFCKSMWDRLVPSILDCTACLPPCLHLGSFIYLFAFLCLFARMSFPTLSFQFCSSSASPHTFLIFIRN